MATPGQERPLTVDVHGMTTDEAISYIEEQLREATIAGVRSIKVIHGAPEIQSGEEAGIAGRGYIKTKLLLFLELPDTLGWDQYVAGYERENGATIIFLK